MILYDISTIGRCRRLSWPRAGITRVVEAGLQGLFAMNLEGFTACSASPADLQGYLDYVSEEATLQPGTPEYAAKGYLAYVPHGGERWRPPPLVHSENRRLRLASAVQGRVNTKIVDLTNSIGHAPMTQMMPSRVARRVLSAALEVGERKFATLDWRSLRQAKLYHSPADGFPDIVNASPRLPKIITVYDLIPLLRTQYCTSGQQKWMGGVLRSAERGWACAISQATKDDLCEHVKIAPERVFVTPLAAAPEIFYHCTDTERLQNVRSRYGIPEGPYIISVCTLEPRKNLDHLVRCFARLAREGQARDLSLVLVGGKGWMADNIFQALDEATGDPALSQILRGRIVLTGFAPDEDLAPLYSGALAFAYLSFYEGFGLPPLEAMQCGVPVITSNTTSLPEVVGDAGILLDPKDEDGLCSAILELHGSQIQREQMAARSLERATHFSWQRFIEDTMAAYQAVLQDA